MRTTPKNKWDVLDYQSYDLPVFSIWFNKENYQLIASGAFHNWDDADLVEIEFVDFFKALMTGSIQYSLKPNAIRSIQVSMNTIQCWKCKKPTNTIMEINYFIPHAKGFTKIHQSNVEDLSHLHCETLNHPDLINSYQYGLLKKRFSKTRGESYLSNGCFYCDALQGAFFSHHERDTDNMKHSQFIDVQIDHDTKIDGLWFYLG